jgi:hypothetical protein
MNDISAKNVCSSGWHGNHSSYVTLTNHNSNIITVKDSGDPNCPFPFETPPSPFNISAKVGSTPGTVVAQLKNTPGTYCYSTEGCPGDHAVLTNPKTVIIS